MPAEKSLFEDRFAALADSSIFLDRRLQFVAELEHKMKIVFVS